MFHNTTVQSPMSIQSSSGTTDRALRSRVDGLEKRLARMEVQTKVLLELVRDSLKLTPADMKARMREMDLRDGVEDGQITRVPLRCPQCNRVTSSHHWKCLYCNLDFEEGVY